MEGRNYIFKKVIVFLCQTPARALKGHVSTGHADSPVTIVVGRAHKRTDSHPPGAAPRVVTNTALLKKDLKMDENLSGSNSFSIKTNGSLCYIYVFSFVATYDVLCNFFSFLSGISEMFKTPANERKRGATKTETPAMSEVEPTLLNTPEEPGNLHSSGWDL